MIRPFASLLTLLALIASAVGCGSEDSEPAGGLESSISISRGGGIAGSFYETKVEPDGSGVFDQTEYTGQEVEPESFEVDEAELEGIADVAAETPFEEIGEATNADCYDCFVYTITYGDQELTVDSSTLEEGEPGAEASDLIEVLSRVGPEPNPKG